MPANTVITTFILSFCLGTGGGKRIKGQSHVRLENGQYVFDFSYYFAPIEKRSIVISVAVCVPVCVFVWPQSYLQNTHPIFSKFLCMLCLSVFYGWRHFCNKLRLLDVVARLRQWGSPAGLGLAHRNTRCRQQMLGSTSCSQGLLDSSGCVEYLWHRVCT